MKRNCFSAILLIIVICVIVFLAYYLFFTTGGSSLVTKLALSRYISSEDIDFKSVNGNLAQTLSYEDIVFNDPRFLPEGSTLKIQRLDISFTSLSLTSLKVGIYNGILRIPNLDIILVNGGFGDRNLNLNLYSKNVGVHQALELFGQRNGLKKISGLLTDLDVYIKGTFFDPELTGTLIVDKLTREKFSITKAPCSFSLHLKEVKDELKLFGSVSLDSGAISGPKTAVINLLESNIIFKGDPKKPSFDVEGISTVEKVKIEIVLRGTLDSPELKLKSNPSLPQEKLLVMLATNRSWKGAEAALSQGQISASLAQNFLDYFVFSGSGSKIAQKLGISDISVKYDGQTKSIGVTRDITGSTSVSYSVEQSQDDDAKKISTQKIETEHKITESISIGAEKEIKQDDRNEQTTDEKVILKFKKKF